MSKVKAILIDAKEQEIKEIEYDTKNGIQDIYDVIGCRCFCVAADLSDGNTVYVDDEGYLNGTKSFFKFKSMDTQWFAGNGLVMRDDMSENTVDTTVDVEKLEQDVIFMICDNESCCPKPPPIQIISW